MRSSRFSLFAVAALVAVGAAACSIAYAGVDAVYAVARTVRRTFGLAFDLFTAPTPKSTAETKPRVVLVAAREFLAKQMQRSRPPVTTRWRMCPSA